MVAIRPKRNASAAVTVSCIKPCYVYQACALVGTTLNTRKVARKVAPTHMYTLTEKNNIMGFDSSALVSGVLAPRRTALGNKEPQSLFQP